MRSVNAAFDPEFREEGVTRGVNVATDGNNNYADLIVSGQKQFETRDTDSLRPMLVKELVLLKLKRGEGKASWLCHCW